MTRSQRLLGLLQVLRRHRRPVRGADLARELGVSLRTLYRDIAALQAMGARIEGEPGVGYVLRPGFLLPPLMFRQEEIEALSLGLRWVARRTDPAMSAAAREALARIGTVLPPSLRERLDDEALLVGPGWDRPQAADLSLLRRSLAEERKLALSYADEKNRRTERVVWPVALGFFETTRVLVAWCELRKGFRHFRHDRILAAHLLPDPLPSPRRQLVRQWRRTLLTEPDSRRRYTVTPTSDTEESPMNEELVFYTNPQSRGAIVHWMLEEVGCPYRVQVLDYGSTMKSPEYLAVNPMGKVPAIRHGEEVVTEAAAICAYLADAFPEAGLAPAPEHRGAYYRWLFFAAGCAEPAMSNHSVGWDPPPDMQPRFGYGSFERTFDTLAGWLQGRRYVAGERFSAADVYVASLLNFGMMFQIVPRRPEFEAYVGPLLERPARKRAEERVQQLAAQHAWQGA